MQERVWEIQEEILTQDFRLNDLQTLRLEAGDGGYNLLVPGLQARRPQQEECLLLPQGHRMTSGSGTLSKPKVSSSTDMLALPHLPPLPQILLLFSAHPAPTISR